MSGESRQSLMDELLRGGIPEIKLGLGEVIDRENARPLPPRYARLLPETLLVVTLRPDAADALAPIAADLERELTDSCTRHGSLYERAYRVRLQRSGDHNAPLYVVSTRAGKDIGGSGGNSEGGGAPGGDGADPVGAEGERGGLALPSREPLAPQSPSTPRPAAIAPGSASISAAPDAGGATPGIPISDDEVTRSPDHFDADWHPGRWVLVVESAEGDEREVFRISEPLITVGRRTNDPSLRATVAISDAPNVSRRQLALEWEDRDGAAGFKVYNLGLNPLHIPGREIAGSRAGKATTDLDRVGEEFTGWVPPGVPMRIGDHGPTLRIEEIPAPEEDPERDSDATVYE